MTEQSEHLSSAQIENYGIRTSGAGPDAAQRDEHQRLDHQSSDDQKINDQSVEAHLADCPSCRNRLLDFHRSLFASPAYPPEDDRPKTDDPKNDPPENDTSVTEHSSSVQKAADSKLDGGRHTDSALADSNFANPKYPADPQVRTAPTPECPSEDALRQLAAGLTPDDLAPALTRHAATCNHCGPLLRTFTEDFSDDFSPEEQAALAQLHSASPAWQRQTVREMLKRSLKPAPLIFPWKWITAPAAAAAACALLAVGIGVTWYARRNTPEKVDKLLAQAYTDNRNMEMRIPYAKHSDFHQVQGDTGSILNLPDSYREASVPIASNLKKHPDDPTWLLLSARFDLLHWDYKSAFSTLERIDDPKVIESSEARLTRALALYEKAEAENQQRDPLYAEIVELMGKTLQKDPDDPAALFNQAIACEKLHMYECAIGDYKHLLDVERDRGWAGEATQHLRDLQEKKNRSQ